MAGWVRIIGGKWRGRRVKVLDKKGLRPTSNRVRETLFNWLHPFIEDAVCLDLYAGTGALGFEALSRGARHVVFVDKEQQITTLLREELEKLAGDGCVYTSAMLKNGFFNEIKFDIVFLDPPFAENLLAKSCIYLEEQKILQDTAYIYLEADKPIEDNDLPANWQLIKKQKAGQVFFHLAKRVKDETA